jgi:hypothetical protein
MDCAAQRAGAGAMVTALAASVDDGPARATEFDARVANFGVDVDVGDVAAGNPAARVRVRVVAAWVHRLRVDARLAGATVATSATTE